MESISAARAFQRAEDRPISADRELGALGLANVVASLLRGMPAGGACHRRLAAGAGLEIWGVLPPGSAEDAVMRFQRIFGPEEVQLFASAADAVATHLDQLGGPTDSG